jgi:catechol 2,3-dioxygenase-like lactoylglutathione lyase family enzyme
MPYAALLGGMLSGPAWLALEVKSIEPVRAFYEDTLAMPVRREEPTEVAFDAGDSALVLREPGAVPRGGLHVHYAFSVPPASYGDWLDRLSADHDLDEVEFGDLTSLYLYDPVCNCVELGQGADLAADAAAATEADAPADPERDAPGAIAGIFEVVLEVEDLDRAEHFYRTLGFEVVDRGDGRRRVRMSVDDLDLELWEPQLGLADARGGVHVDLGLRAEEPNALANQLVGQALGVTDPERGRRIRDPDGHWISLVPAD